MVDFTVELFDRLQDEADFFDREATRASTLRQGLRMTNQFSYEEYFALRRPYAAVSDFFGKISGKQLLDYACGTGWASIYFARSGATCHGIDISGKSIDVARRTSVLNGYGNVCEFRVAAGESLPYDDNTFDLVFGNAALHHVDLEMAPEEIARVLKPGGKAAFIDDLRYHPVLWLYRRITRKKHTLFEQPLTLDDLKFFKRYFSSVQAQVFDLVNLLPKASGLAKVTSTIDDELLKVCPPLRKLCRYVVIKLVK